jgi:UDP-2,4-diacetamido-2,4,6-trideoxy-beta-L-altropyranose hydrolase
MRCLTLAERLAASGWRCAFATAPESLGVAPALERSGFEVLETPEDAGPECLAEQWPQGAGLLVVDHYGLDAGFESGCRGWAEKILVIDDLADRPHDCDLLLDVTPGVGAGRYRGLVRDDCRMLLGPEYCLLREEFSGLRPGALARRQGEGEVERILLSFGLTDPAGAAAKALEGILDAGTGARIDVILGRNAPGRERLLELAGGNEGVALREYVPDMAELMAETDLALGAAGTTSWERCCLGLPTILVVAADNQENNAAGLAAAGAALNLGRVDDSLPSRVREAVARLVADSEARREMSMAAAGLCDGLGAERTALAVQPAVAAGDAGMVRLRPAGSEDMETMYGWQKHPETRRFARNPDVPERSEHEDWFRKTIADPTRALFIIEYEGEDAGVFRLDRLEGGAREVSIVVAPEFRGRGVGGAALKFANGFWPKNELHAEVLSGNEASRNMFLRAGFEPSGETLYVRPSR